MHHISRVGLKCVRGFGWSDEIFITVCDLKEEQHLQTLARNFGKNEVKVDMFGAPFKQLSAIQDRWDDSTFVFCYFFFCSYLFVLPNKCL